MPGSFPADVVLNGDGFLLRPLRRDDARDVALAASDEVTMQWLPLPRPYTEATALEFITEIAPAQQADGSGIVRAIEVSGRFAGCIDLKKTDWRAGVTEVGYWVAPWGRGRRLAGRAARLVAEWALREHGLERVELHAAARNDASQRSAEVPGFTREGVLRNAGFTHEGRVDLVVYSLIRSDLDGPRS